MLKEILIDNKINIEYSINYIFLKISDQSNK